MSETARRSLPFELAALADMITSHSQFDTITRPIPDENPTTKAGILQCHPAKASVLSFFATILSLDPVHCCRVNYLPALAAAYQGTVSDEDQAVMRIWQIYETKGGVSVAASAVGWGGNAGAGVVGLSATSAADALNPIDAVRMAHSVQWFEFDGGG